MSDESKVVPTNDSDAAERVGERVVINVSGFRIETQVKTLNLFPDTLLGDPERRKRYYDTTRHEYFFDRCRRSFEAILHYYQSGGHLLRPLDVPMPLFTEDIRFFELGDDAMGKYREDEGLIKEEPPQPGNGLRGKAWLLLECPESSIAARITAIVSACITLIFVVVLCLDSMPEFQHYNVVGSSGPGMNIIDERIPDPFIPFLAIKAVCIVCFTLELVIRFLCCPKKLEFFKSIKNLIEIVASIPPFIALPFFIVDPNDDVLKALVALAILRATHLIRVMCIFRAPRQILQILGRAMKASVPDMSLLLIILLTAAIIFATAIYIAEVSIGNIRSIPEGLWWAVVTMTTVGYGDVYPQTPWGRFVASLCAMVGGILTIGLPIVVIATHFRYFYRRHMDQEYEAKHKMNRNFEIPQQLSLG